MPETNQSMQGMATPRSLELSDAVVEQNRDGIPCQLDRMPATRGSGHATSNSFANRQQRQVRYHPPIPACMIGASRSCLLCLETHAVAMLWGS